MSSIKVLRIYGKTSPESREKLLKMTPNVKTLLLCEYCPNCDPITGRNYKFINGFRVILNNLPKLQTFEWVISQSIHLELLYSLDAAVTGLPEYFCWEMSEKLLNEDNLSANDLALIELEREHSSILDLKGKWRLSIYKNMRIDLVFVLELKKLDIQFHFSMSDYDAYLKNEHKRFPADWHECGYTETSKFYRTGFTKLAQFVAFDHMPNVEIHMDIVYE